MVVTNWTDLVENRQAIATLYTDTPSLEPFNLVEVRTDRDGPVLYLRGNLRDFPQQPSPRWPADANTLQITFQLVGLRSLSVQGWATTNRGPLTIEREDSHGVRVLFDSSECTIRAIGNWLYAAQFDAFRQECEPQLR